MHEDNTTRHFYIERHYTVKTRTQTHTLADTHTHTHTHTQPLRGSYGCKTVVWTSVGMQTKSLLVYAHIHIFISTKSTVAMNHCLSHNTLAHTHTHHTQFGVIPGQWVWCAITWPGHMTRSMRCVRRRVWLRTRRRRSFQNTSQEHVWRLTPIYFKEAIKFVVFFWKLYGCVCRSGSRCFPSPVDKTPKV